MKNDYEIRQVNIKHDIYMQHQELNVLWDAKQDKEKIDNHFKILRLYDLAMRTNMKFNNKKYRMLHDLKTKLYNSFEEKLIRYYYDKKSGTRWKDGRLFEPHQVVFQKNAIMWKGLSDLVEIIAQESILEFFYFAIGIGTGDVNKNLTALENEILRQDVRQAGSIVADNNILKHTATFPETLTSNNFSEYAVMNAPTGGNALFISRVSDAEDKLKHTQDVTLPQVSHQTAFRAR